MLFFDFPEMKKLHEQIDDKDIYIDDEDDSYGLEDEPHCTILYGLDEEVILKDVKYIVKNYEFGPLLLHNASLFENKKYDVLKFDIQYVNKDDNFLHDCNNEMRDELPYESAFPDYHPHATLCYLLPGKGKKYVKLFKDEEYEVMPTHVVYSEVDGSKTDIKIKINSHDLAGI